MEATTPNLMNLTWQGFVLLNLVSLIVLAFWTGRQAQKIEDQGKRIEKLEVDSQPVGIVTERLDNMVQAVARLTDRFDEFEKSENAAMLRAIHGALKGARG